MTIKEIRKHTNLSQEEFAKKYKIPVSTLKKWEDGKRGVSISTENFIKFQVAKDYPHLLHFIAKDEKIVLTDNEVQEEK